MQHRLLGRTGLWASPFCLGCLNFGDPTPPDEAVRIIHQALDAGINLLDTADMYGDGESERVVGKALKNGRRDRVILATKVYFPTSADPNDRGNSRHHIMNAVDRSLKRLDTDWIDLYQLHRPDFDVPHEETLRALDDLVRQGKVRYIGCSTFPAWMVMEGLALSRQFGWAAYVTEQPPYNLLDRRIENELIPLAQRHDLGLLTWSPLAMGLLAGRYENEEQLPEGSRAARAGWVYADRVTGPAVQASREITAVARQAGHTPIELALAWVINQPGITAAIVGPRTGAHLKTALAAADTVLQPDVLARLDEIMPPGTAVSDFFNSSGWMKG